MMQIVNHNSGDEDEEEGQLGALNMTTMAYDDSYYNS